MVDDRVLALFAKAPNPGLAKTRLGEARSPAWAARVADAFIADLSARFQSIRARRFVAFTPADAAPYFDQVAGSSFELVDQGQGDLGERLTRFMDARFSSKATAVVVVGTDSPTLPIEFVHDAFNRLEHADVVLGPAMDGGYYLVGCRRIVRGLFEKIRWGSRHVLGDTVDQLRGSEYSLALLPPWYDVDTMDGWDFLVVHLAALRLAGLDPQVPRTEQVIDGDRTT